MFLFSKANADLDLDKRVRLSWSQILGILSSNGRVGSIFATFIDTVTQPSNLKDSEVVVGLLNSGMITW